MDIFHLIFKYEYLQNAYIIGILIGLLAPILGAYVVIKRLGLIVDGISHITLAGISFAMLLDKLTTIYIYPLYMGIAFSLGGALLIDKISSSFRNYKELAIPIVISLSTALMVLFASLAGGFTQDFISYMFGNILTTTKSEVYIILVTAIVVLILLKKYYYQMMGYAIDENYCKYSGINTKYYKLVFNIVISVIIAISIKVVGMMLVSSLVVIPITSASKVTNSFKKAVLLGILFSEISVILGLILSYYLNIPSGATIVFINLIFFGGAMAYGNRKQRVKVV